MLSTCRTAQHRASKNHRDTSRSKVRRDIAALWISNRYGAECLGGMRDYVRDWRRPPSEASHRYLPEDSSSSPDKPSSVAIPPLLQKSACVHHRSPSPRKPDRAMAARETAVRRES